MTDGLLDCRTARLIDCGTERLKKIDSRLIEDTPKLYAA